MHTEIYCASLGKLDRTKAIRAIHQAWLQLAAMGPVDHNDNAPALASLAQCLKDAGHLAFDGV